MEEVIWQEHTHILEKAPGVGFGIAVSGGLENPNAENGDPSIIISDVIPQGPAFDKLKTNDIVLRVNGRPMINVEHRLALKELRNSGFRVELTVRRKVIVQVATPPQRRSRSRSRDLDSLPRRYRSHSRDLDRESPRSRYRSRSRDLDDSRRRHRSRSRDLDSDYHRASRRYSRSPPQRRSYSRSPTRSHHRGRSRSPSPSRHRSPSVDSRPSYHRGRSRTPPRRRQRSRSHSFSPSSRSITPPRHVSPPRLEKHKSLEDFANHLSPDPDDVTPVGDMISFPVKTREPKTVVLKKTRSNNSYGLKLGTRIFIQDIQPGSLADKSIEIDAGDTVLMINGRNVDNKSVQEAIQIIGLSKDKVTMLIKKADGGTVSIPSNSFNLPADKSEASKNSDSESDEDPPHRSRKRSRSRHSERITEPVAVDAPKIAPKPKKKEYGGVRVLPSGGAAPTDSSSSSSSRRSSPEPAPRLKHNLPMQGRYDEPPGSDDDVPVLPPTAREIIFKKGKSVGIRLAGGNDVGIFVASVQEGSPAAKQGLKMGDQILSVNNINFRNIIREEAVLTLMGLPAGDEVNLVAQTQHQAYKKVLEHGTGDSFYIRTHFKYEKNGQHEMSFDRGSSFRVSDTLYQGMVGYWLAVRIGRNNKEIERGVIPNRTRAEQLKMVQDKKITQLRERNNRGIGRRLMKNQKADPPVSSSASTMFPAYERVVLREAGFKRPVVVFGPLADIARQRLAGDYPDFYDIARNEGTVRGQKSNRKGVIRLNTIKDIIEQDKHAILDITPTAVEKLNYAQLYPIVVFLESQSKGEVKDVRQKLAVTEEEKKKKAGKLFDRANKLQRGYSHVFTDTINLYAGNDDWYRRLHSTIKDQQNMPVWVTENKLGAGVEDAEEGITVPGDDDQFSYVSAPASDYSVTTVGSDTLGRDDEDVTRDVEDVTRDVEDVTRDNGRSLPSTTSEDDGGVPSDTHPHNTGTKALLPPSEKKIHPPPVMNRPPSSSSSEDQPPEPPIPIVAPRPFPGNRPIPRKDPLRGKQEIPEGRFDPKAFLKTHISGRRQVSRDDTEEVEEQNRRDETFSEMKRAPNYNSPSAMERQPPQQPAYQQPPQQPVYSQVNKDRKPFQSEPPRQQDNTSKYPTSIQPKPYQPYNSNKPQPYQRPPIQMKPPGLASSLPSHKPGPTYKGRSNPTDSNAGSYNSGRPTNTGVPVSSSIGEDDPQVVATARGFFDSNGGVLSSMETGVSIHIPKMAIRPGIRQEIYFKVCKDNSALPPLDKEKGETLLSPLVMCGPHGLQFDQPVELRLPHCEPSQWHNVRNDGDEVGSNSVSVLIDHF